MLLLTTVAFCTHNTSSYVTGSEKPIIAYVFAGEPWAEIDTNTPGVIPTFYAALEQEADTKLDIQVVPYKRMLNLLETGEGDLAIFFKSGISLEIAEPLVKLTTLNTIIYPRQDLSINSYEDLSSLTVGVKRGVVYQPKFDNDTSLSKVAFSNYEQGLIMLERGRIDALVGSEVSLKYGIKKLGLSSTTISNAMKLDEKEVWLQISINSQMKQQQRQLIIKAAEQLVERDTYQQLIQSAIK